MIVSGHASVFGALDLKRDITMPGWFLASIKARGIYGVRLLLEHEPWPAVGVWDEIAENSKGLFVRGRICGSTSRAAEAIRGVASGELIGLSIGFKTVRAVRRGAVRIVRWPALDLACLIVESDAHRRAA